MMIVILFHDFNNDRGEKRLNNALRSNGIGSLDSQDPVHVIRFPDGCLIVCWDTMPIQAQLNVIQDEVKEAGKEAGISLILHEHSPYKNDQENNIRELIHQQYELKEYIHEPFHPIYKGLSDILTHSGLSDLLPYFKEYDRSTLPKRFSTLEHRIAHLWLPLDIDLQGIQEVRSGKSEVRGQSPEEIAVEYLKEVLEDKNGDTPQYYRQKLAKLQYSIAGEYVDFSQADGSIECENSKIKECSPVKPQDKANLLIDNKSIYDLILESEKKTDILRSQEWTNLLTLCGLEKDGTGKDLKPIEFHHSPILYFMCLMDCMISNPGSRDVTKVLDPFDNREVKDVNPERIKSFHDWFCALDDCLDKLRGNL